MTHQIIAIVGIILGSSLMGFSAGTLVALGKIRRSSRRTGELLDKAKSLTDMAEIREQHLIIEGRLAVTGEFLGV